MRLGLLCILLCAIVGCANNNAGTRDYQSNVQSKVQENQAKLDRATVF